MSDLSTNERSSFGEINGHNHARPKCQPIRVKALLESYESDDDESEDKGQESEDESDEDFQLIPQDESNENIAETLIEVQNPANLLCIRKENPEDKKNYVESQFSISKREQCEEKSSAVTDLPVFVQTHSNDYYDRNNVKEPRSCRKNLLTSVPSTYHDVMQNIKPEKSAITLPSNAKQLHHESRDTSEKISHQENANRCIVPVESQEHSSSRSEEYQLAQTTERSLNSNEFPIGDHCNAKESANTEVESLWNQNSGNIMQSTNQNLQNIGIKDNILSNDPSHLVTETPVKHAPIESTRPHPCFSRRNIANTPQNKLHGDLVKSHMHTPVTVLSHWSQSNIGRTPLTTRNITVPDCVPSSQTAAYRTPASSHKSQGLFSKERSSARKPLADTTSMRQNDTVYPLDVKSRLLQSSQLPRVDERIPSVQQNAPLDKKISKSSNMVKRTLEVSEKTVTQIENCHNDIVVERRHSNVGEMANPRETLEPPKVSERKQARTSNENSVLQEVQQPSYATACSQKAQVELAKTVSNVHSDVGEVGNPRETLKHSKVSERKQTRTSNENPVLQEAQQPSYATVSNQKPQVELAKTVSNVQFSLPKAPSVNRPETITVKGREYLVLGILGKGMSGEVLRVQDLTSRELCAIKCVNLSLMDKDSAQGCLEEISMLHKLQAPCVVRMFDYEIKSPMVYVVMEMGDTDLSRLLKSMSQDKQLPLTMILYYWTEMLTAVKHIHDNGVIHSDLKPANFLLVRGRLKLIDFGIASSINGDMTSVVKNCPIGTMNYISPEALMDIGGDTGSPTHNVKFKINFKSDVWSLGCILYSLVYGYTPFHHIRQQWAKVNAITNPKPSISYPPTMGKSEDGQNSTYIPPILIDVMRKCLQHNPKARPTVEQLLQIPYIPTKPECVVKPISTFPMDMLVQAKHVLNEDEWRQLTQLLEKVRSTTPC